MDSVDKKQDTSPPPGGSKKAIILIILIVVLAAVYLFYFKPLMTKFEENPITQDLLAIKDQILEMDTLTKSQIEQQAAAVDAADLINDPTGWSGQYVTLTGLVSSEETSTLDANMVRNIFSETNFKAYVLNEKVAMIDLTGEGGNYPDGATLRGYGKVFHLRIADIWDLPIVGPNLKQEFRTEGMDKDAIFFLSKGADPIDVVAEESNINPCDVNPCGDNPCDFNPCDVNPCDENPCGENPCDENPCGENPCGENPCGENPCG